MTFFRALLLLVLSTAYTPVHAVTLAGVEIPDSAQVGDNKLLLNGAGVRSAFIFDVYAIGLYLPHAQTKTSAILGSAQARRIAIHCIFNKITKSQFDNSIQDGLEDNLTDEEMASIADRLAMFTEMFGEVVENDVVHIDFEPGNGTTFSFNGEVVGRIPGEDFNDALLSIWIGEEPVTKELKSQLLGN